MAADLNLMETEPAEISLRSDDFIPKSRTSGMDLLPEILDTDSLSHILVRRGLITRMDLIRINYRKTPIRKSRLLVKILADGVKEYPFLKALEDTGQKHVANFIRNSGDRQGECDDDWSLPAELLHQLDVMQRKCDSLLLSDKLLQRLHVRKCISNRQYRVLINISKRKTAQRVDVLIGFIKQKNMATFAAFLSCMKEINEREAKMITELQNAHTDYHQRQTSRSTAAGNECHIGKLTVLILEPLLSRGVAMLRDTQRTIPTHTPREAVIDALITVTYVCRKWYNVVMSRKYIKRQLKKQLHLLPQVMVSIDTKCRKIRGVALLDSRLYVIGRRSNDVRVYSTDPPYNRLNDAHVRPLKWPRDMVACGEQQCLYITDNNPETNCVWQVNIAPEASGEIVTQWITVPRGAYEPWMISGTSSRLVVLPWVGKHIYVYGSRGELLQETTLPTYYDARHAIETESGHFFVADIDGHKKYIQEDRITKVTASGDETHSYGRERGEGSDQLSDPCHLALDSRGRLLVADHYNDRVILLNSDLTFCRQLLSGKEDQRNVGQQKTAQMAEPRRLSYDKRSGLLAVGLQSGHVNLYHWKQLG